MAEPKRIPCKGLRIKSLIAYKKSFNFSFFKDFVYLYDRERAHAGGIAEGDGEADSALRREPNIGLDPRAPGL